MTKQVIKIPLDLLLSIRVKKHVDDTETFIIQFEGIVPRTEKTAAVTQKAEKPEEPENDGDNIH